MLPPEKPVPPKIVVWREGTDPDSKGTLASKILNIIFGIMLAMIILGTLIWMLAFSGFMPPIS
jgi:hypothetical protein